MKKVTRAYDIDLAEPASTRWNKMIHQERDRGQSLIKNCIAEAKLLAGTTAVNAAMAIFGKLHKSKNGLYRDDLQAWARGLDVRPNELLLANLSYELAQTGAYFAGMASPISALYHRFTKAFGFCTAAAYNGPNHQGLTHVRNMDWPLTDCGTATCLIHYHGKKGPFTSIGWPGYVGVLSGVAKGRFSATINQAPQIGRPTAHCPSAFALRWNFENSTSYQDFVTDLKETQMAASTFFMVVGTQKNQAVVIEHTGTETAERPMKNNVLALANHYESEAFRHHNYPEMLEGSQDRRDCAYEFAKQSKPNQPLLKASPACHDLSCQFMSMNPKTGNYNVSFQNTDQAVADLYEENVA